MTFTATRRDFWDASAPKMHLRSGLSPEHCWGNLQRSLRPPSWWGGGSLTPPQEPICTVGLQP